MKLNLGLIIITLVASANAAFFVSSNKINPYFGTLMAYAIPWAAALVALYLDLSPPKEPTNE